MDGGDIAIIIFVTIVFGFLISGIAFLLIGEVKFSEAEECFNQIATEYCEANNLTFEDSWWDISSHKFDCKTDERKRDSEIFYFTEEEEDKCYNKDKCCHEHTHEGCQ